MECSAKKVAWSRFHIKSEVLPPTSAAAKYHSSQVFHQVKLWMDKNLSASEWGWVIKNEQMQPTITDLGCAPSELLSLIRCNCPRGWTWYIYKQGSAEYSFGVWFSNVCIFLGTGHTDPTFFGAVKYMLYFWVFYILNSIFGAQFYSPGSSVSTVLLYYHFVLNIY